MRHDAILERELELEKLAEIVADAVHGRDSGGQRWLLGGRPAVAVENWPKTVVDQLRSAVKSAYGHWISEMVVRHGCQ